MNNIQMLCELMISKVVGFNQVSTDDPSDMENKVDYFGVQLTNESDQYPMFVSLRSPIGDRIDVVIVTRKSLRDQFENGLRLLGTLGSSPMPMLGFCNEKDS